MNMREELIALRKEAIQKAESIKVVQKTETESFFRLAQQRLISEFNKNPETTYLSIGINPQDDRDLIQNLCENKLLDHKYLKTLCKMEGIKLQIMDDGTWYPSFWFEMNLVEKKEIKR